MEEIKISLTLCFKDKEKLLDDLKRNREGENTNGMLLEDQVIDYLMSVICPNIAYDGIELFVDDIYVEKKQ